MHTVIKPYIQKLFQILEIKPFRIKYNLEKREPDFEKEMHNVLVVYKQVSLRFDEKGNIVITATDIKTVTKSCDKKSEI